MIEYELDKKILILYILRNLSCEIDFDTLYEIVNDNNIGYFDFAECLNDLIENGNVQKKDDSYIITEEGIKNSEAVINELSASVKKKTDLLLPNISKNIKRNELIKSSYYSTDDGNFIKLSLSDGFTDIITLNLLVSDEAHANILKKNFKKSAEKIYKDIMEKLS